MIRQISVSATITQGSTQNHVRVKKPRTRKPKSEPKRYRSDRSVIGLGARVIAISMPPAEIATMDALADRAQMARSHLIRQAVKYFAAHVLQHDAAAQAATQELINSMRKDKP